MGERIGRADPYRAAGYGSEEGGAQQETEGGSAG